MTSFPELIATRLIDIKDRDSLRLVGRVIESQVTVLEAQLVQLKELHEGVNQQLEVLGK